MSSAAIGLLIMIGSILAIDFIAWRWGADTRVGRDWQWGEDRDA
jgi:hypothetical protein